MRHAARTAFAVSISLAKIAGPSSDMLFIALYDKLESNFSAKPSLSRNFTEIENTNAFKKSGACSVPIERIVREKK